MTSPGFLRGRNWVIPGSAASVRGNSGIRMKAPGGFQVGNMADILEQVLLRRRGLPLRSGNNSVNRPRVSRTSGGYRVVARSRERFFRTADDQGP